MIFCFSFMIMTKTQRKCKSNYSLKSLQQKYIIFWSKQCRKNGIYCSLICIQSFPGLHSPKICINAFNTTLRAESLSVLRSSQKFPIFQRRSKETARNIIQNEPFCQNYGIDFGRATKRPTLYDDRSLNRVFSIPIAVHAKDENLKALNETRVVIIGGGYGGIAAANKLKDQCKLTLIDARDAFHHNMGAQRSSVETGAWNLLCSIVWMMMASNRPFPSTLLPLFQNESRCTIFVMIMGSLVHTLSWKSKSFPYERMSTWTRSEKVNSEVAYLSTLSLSIPIMHLPSLLEGPYG